MRHEKQIKLANGDTLIVVASLYVEHMKDEFYWNSYAELIPKGKRKSIMLEEATYDEIIKVHVWTAKQELWQKVKP